MHAQSQNSWEYALACAVVYAICFIVTCGMVYKHVFQVYQEHGCATPGVTKGDGSDTDFDLYVIHYGTFISAFSFCAIIALALAMRLFEFARITGLYPCKVHPVICAEFLTAAKCAMYAVFVARIRVCFDNSVYAYSKRTIHAMYAAVVIAFVVFICLHPILGHAHWQETEHATNGRHVHEKGGKRSMVACTVHMTKNTKLLFVAMLLFDVVFSVSVVCMFIRPLNAIFKRKRQSASAAPNIADPEQARFELLPFKCVLLSGTAIASTFVAIALSALTDTGILFPVDNSVNVACLLAMTGQWKGCYWRVCGPLLRCLSNAPCVAEHNRTNIVAMTAMHESISSENR